MSLPGRASAELSLRAFGRASDGTFESMPGLMKRRPIDHVIRPLGKRRATTQMVDDR